jgi:hypothetical protein
VDPAGRPPARAAWIWRHGAARPTTKINLMPRLLVVHHTPSPGPQAMFEAVVSGTAAGAIVGAEVEVRPAPTAAVCEVLAGRAGGRA